MMDTATLLSSLRSDFQEHHFVHWDENNYKVLLLLSACGANCARVDGFSGSIIKVDHESVNCWPIARSDMASEVIRLISRVISIR